MVPVPPAGVRLTITGFDYNNAVPAPDFLIDRTEVTNAEFKAFVDAGGYAKREYWTEPFVRDGQPLDGPPRWRSSATGRGVPGRRPGKAVRRRSARSNTP